ncbi:MAG: hypothetical protein ACI8PZ_003930 [Myxococcota bacterium]|jgi:hypothetical protein
MKKDPIDAILWPLLLGMAAFVGIFMLEHFKIVSTPPTRAAYVFVMEKAFF